MPLYYPNSSTKSIIKPIINNLVKLLIKTLNYLIILLCINYSTAAIAFKLVASDDYINNSNHSNNSNNFNYNNNNNNNQNNHYTGAFETNQYNFKSIAIADLPKEAQKTLYLIQQGGPFPYKHKDGSVFKNREYTLPKKPRGYYTEYTVKTPYSRNRGTKRIIAGQGHTGNPATSGEYFYTDDHYASFKKINQ